MRRIQGESPAERSSAIKKREMDDEQHQNGQKERKTFPHKKKIGKRSQYSNYSQSRKTGYKNVPVDGQQQRVYFRTENSQENQASTSHWQDRKVTDQKNRKVFQNQDFKQTSSNWKSDNPYKFRIGFKLLQELANEPDPDTLVIKVSEKLKAFEEFFSSDIKSDMFVLMVEILLKVSEANFSKAAILQKLLSHSFIAKLTTYIVQLELQSVRERTMNRLFWNNPENFWNNIVEFSKNLYEFLPNLAVEVLPKFLKTVNKAMTELQASLTLTVYEETKIKVQSLIDVLDTMSKKYDNEQNKPKVHDKDDIEPPNNFRNISIYPTAEELTTIEKPFLRSNRVKGPYKNVDEYLDVQFRLLREDFVMPLRQAICAYRDPNNHIAKKKQQDVRIYKNVQLINEENINSEPCFRLKFQRGRRKINYEHSKHLLFGSLLCFTSDSFKTILFGKIAQRDVKDLENGEIIVNFCNNAVISKDVNYLMLESKAYFEPYYYALKVLQSMNPQSFPMEKYILKVEKDADYPAYLKNPELVAIYKVNGKEFLPTDWPNEKIFTRLNNSQDKAFRAALTKEFAIIQGPPGTGKTYLGIKVARALIDNSKYWYNSSPMLIICYTNHALDQFLQGISKYTKSIIRIGNRSKNTELDRFNIRNQRSSTSNHLNNKRIEVLNMGKALNNISNILKKIYMFDSVLNIQTFPNISDHWVHFKTKEELKAWLFLGLHITKSSVVRDDLSNDLQPDIDNAEAHDEEEHKIELDDILDEVRVDSKIDCLVSIEELEKKIREKAQQIDSLTKILDVEYDQALVLKFQEMEFDFHKLNQEKIFLKECLEKGKEKIAAGNLQPINTENFEKLPNHLRWDLYFYYLSGYIKILKNLKKKYAVQFRALFQEYEGSRMANDAILMKKHLVVGMTTTGAARLNLTLHALKSPIVIVEEAAEVLESHIVASLTKNCQHLILIGDHQQLQPSTTNFTIQTKYFLGVSMFERMVHNGIECHMLNVQHRMRPEISKLIVPTIYTDLENHSSVENRENIKGVTKNVFFVDHRNFEEVLEDDTKKNVFEAKYLLLLAKYLILNGYEPEDITIICTYLGQMFEVQLLRKNYLPLLKGVKVVVLDNYQGEESKIVLLSLVRSNADNNIGFLKKENRVCVALSRARDGFYIVGNMDCFAHEEIWKKIKSSLLEDEAIGPELPLVCQNHLIKTYIKTIDDFSKVAEGGCNLLCGSDLPCGHICKSLCHVEDRNHINYQCIETCNKPLCTNVEHVCKKPCYQDCGLCDYKVTHTLECGHDASIFCHEEPALHKCNVKVPVTLRCGHESEKPCHKDTDTWICPHPCETRVEPCGHACVLRCHASKDPDHIKYKCPKPCARYGKYCTQKTEGHLCPKKCFEECERCEIPVKKYRTVCPHVYIVPCYENVDELFCKKPCKEILACGHKCTNICGEGCGPCTVIVEKAVEGCGHSQRVQCSLEANRMMCSQICPRPLPCGHKCGKKCKDSCETECKSLVPCKFTSPCGHTVTKISCYLLKLIKDNDERLLKFCETPCNAKLLCEHQCSGTCSRCFQGRLHVRCEEKCEYPLACNHLCEMPCRQACLPCRKPCVIQCSHSKCKKLCGEICTRCKEFCTRSCPHLKCNKRCGEICNVKACTEPCQKIISCGHQCIGHCNDVCPKLCRYCDQSELEEQLMILPTDEEIETALFVTLQDCGHTFGSQGLDIWMSMDEHEIKMKVCPKCKVPIMSTSRYSEYVKKCLNDVQLVKNKINGSRKEIQTLREGLIKKISILQKGNVTTVRTILESVLNRAQFQKNERRQYITKVELSSLDIKVKICEEILSISKKFITSNAYSKSILDLIETGLLRNSDQISVQEIQDIQAEINRYERSLEMNNIMAKTDFRYDQILKDLQTIFKFTDELNENIKKKAKELTGLNITEREKIQILSAMNLSKGHWYKCPNGHVYVITECGGAMEKSKCNECGASIGGTNHALLSSNAVATEMDGARYPAWSEQANMNNYEF